ncbi:uncharacterized protein [Onthophagus taurus]|uniref:uncharacterized protein n=1 Tax=Onthophagus taurus TaxID=166361 RepID=UPI0039BE2406
MTEEPSPDAPNWLRELEAKRERRLKAKLGHETGAGSPCLNCKNDCPGLDLHFWRKICKNCKCGKESHDVQDDDIYGYAQFQLLGSKPNKCNKIVLPGKKEEIELEWTPKGQKEAIEKYLKTLPDELLPVKGSAAAQERKQLLQKQIPLHDIDPSLCDSLTEDEVKLMNDYVANIKKNIVGVGQIVHLNFDKTPVNRNLVSDKFHPNYSTTEDVKSTILNVKPLRNLNNDFNRLNIDEDYPENVKNLPVFTPNRVTNREEDKVYPVYPKIQDKIPFISSCVNEKFASPTPYVKIPFTPNARLENSYPVGGAQPVFATILHPNNRTIEDVNRLPLGFREQICVIAPNGERLPVCTNSIYYSGPNGELLVQSPSGERFYVDSKDGRYAIGPKGERLLIGANGEKYYEDPEDNRFVLKDGEKCFVPNEKFEVNPKGQRYQEDKNNKEIFFAEPDNDRYVRNCEGKRFIVDTQGKRYPIDINDGRLAVEDGTKFLLGPKNERYVQDPNDRNVLIGPNGEKFVFPDDRYDTSDYGERFLTGSGDNQKFFADPNDDRYCLGPRGERYRVGNDGNLYKIDNKDGRFLIDPKNNSKFLMGPTGNLFHQDPNDPNYVIGELNDRHYIGEDLFESEPGGVRYLKGENGIKYYADPIQERRAVGPNGEKYLIGANNELFPVDPKDKRFGRDAMGNKICLGPKGEVFYSDIDDRYVIGPDKKKYFVPKNYFNTTPNGEKLISGVNTDQPLKVDPKDDRYALGPRNERFLIGPDGEIYPVDKQDGRFGVNKNNDRIFFDPDGKVYKKDRLDDNCVTGEDGVKYYLPEDRYKTGPTGERYVLNQNKERCVPSQFNDNYAINPKGKRFFVSPKGEVFPVSDKDARFLDDSGKKFMLAPNGEKFYEDPNNPNHVIGPDGQRIKIPKDKFKTFKNGERFLETPYGLKYHPSAKDDNILIGPNGDKHILDPQGNFYKISPEDGRLFEDNNGNKFVFNDDDKKLFKQPNGNLFDPSSGKEYKLATPKYQTSANGDRFIEKNGKKFIPDPIDENYAISQQGDRFLVDPKGNLFPVDSEDARFARGPNGERFLMDADGNVFYPDPYDDKYVIGPKNEKYFLPEDKFITSPSGERFLRDSNGKKYIPDPRNSNLAIGPDGRIYGVNKNKETYPLNTSQKDDNSIISPKQDPRFFTDPLGNNYVETTQGIKFPVNKEDENFVESPDGKTYMLPPNNDAYIVGPNGLKQQLKLPPPTPNKHLIPENAFSSVPEENLEPHHVTVGGIKDIEYENKIKSAQIHHDNNHLEEPKNHFIPNQNPQSCHHCKKLFENDSIVVQIDRANASFHSNCFRCYGCNQNLADLLYFYDKDSDQIYCGRDYAKIKGIPRCMACDELIFVKEYCLAENATFHVKHFCCFECDTPLAGSNYVMEESQPICLSCYETVRASKCAACFKVIKPDEPGATLKGLHFHAHDGCFRCHVCTKPLLNAKLLLRNDKLYCSGVCLGNDQ